MDYHSDWQVVPFDPLQPSLDAIVAIYKINLEKALHYLSHWQ